MDITDKKWFELQLPDKAIEIQAHEFVVTNNGTLVIIQTIDTDSPSPTMAFADGRWLSIKRMPFKPVLQ